jgi:CO/xanthine dehydrogenase FAD-binding subunit
MDVYTPRTLEALLDRISAYPEAAFMTGGTDILVALRSGRLNPKALICLERIEELQMVEDKPDEVFIGAGVTHARILQSSLIREHVPLLREAVRHLGSPQIRNMGTLGGNIVTASPAGDALPPLYALNAWVEIRGAAGTRRVRIDEFIQGPGVTALRPGEIVAGAALPKHEPWDIVHFEKAGKRKALAIAVASLAALVRLSDSGTISDVRLAWGSLGPTIVSSENVEQTLRGKRLTVDALQTAAALARETVSPISDVRAGAGYRRALAGNLLLRLARYSGGAGPRLSSEGA